MRASTEHAPLVPENEAGQKLQLSSSSDPPSSQPPASEDPSGAAADLAPESKPVPQTKAGEIKVQIDAPLVFSGRERARPQTPPAPVSEAAALPLSMKPADPMPAEVVLPPTPDRKPAHKGFFSRVKGFFASIF